jgi:threonine synthase
MTTETRPGLVSGLACRECGRAYPVAPAHVCEFCFGPLEVRYDYGRVAATLTREAIARRPPTMWRYRELLPLDDEPTVGRQVGFTPLVPAPRLGRALGLERLYVKNDAVSFPTLSFKDRVVAVAISKSIEFGFDTVACASTGNLANAVAAQAAAAGLACYVFVPADLEPAKVLGTSVLGARVVAIDGVYDEVNRLCSEIAGKYGWAFANINLRPFYAEGSKTMAFEIAEQLGWRAPAHVVVPMAGGSLITKVAKGLKELAALGLIPDADTKVYGAQAAGCAPITMAVKSGSEVFRPTRPRTIARSLAIGNPADGLYAVQTMRDSGGWGEDASDEEIVEAIALLAETEGIFAETAGGVTVAAARKLAAQGRIAPDEPTVLCVTGNGLKTAEAVAGRVAAPARIRPRLADFDGLLAAEAAAPLAAAL